jgi:uncharacterized protein DUF3551
MKQLWKLSTAPLVTLSALAFVATATPASAGEYCRQDVTSGMRSCSFDSIEQCQAMSAGRGGACYRDPFLPGADTLAYAPNALHLKAERHRANTVHHH